MKLQLLFNAGNKEFIGFGAIGQNEIAKSRLLVKEIELEDGAFNLARYVWSGNYDVGELVDLNKGKGIVQETDVDFKNFDIFARKFNLDVHAIERICKMSFDEYQQFAAMRQTINAKIAREKEFFANSPHHRYIPRDEVKETLEKALYVDQINP